MIAFCAATAQAASTSLAMSATTLSPAVLKMRPRCVAISPSMIRPLKYRLAIASDPLYRLFTVRRDFDLGGFGGKVFTKAAARSSQSRKVRSSRGGGLTKT